MYYLCYLELLIPIYNKYLAVEFVQLLWELIIKWRDREINK